MDTSIFTDNDLYLMLALDHRGSFKKLINPNFPNSVEDITAIYLKKDIITSSYESMSGILIDYNYGYPAYQELGFDKPFLLPAEKSGYTEESGERITGIEFNAQELKEFGAKGVKLLIYFNPNNKSTTKQIETAKKVLENAHENSLPLFLEIVTYDIEDENKVSRSVEMFLENGVKPDVFKLEFPGSEDECKKITGLLKSIPWILLTRGAEFDKFANQLKISIDCGCKGFLAGRALWQELLSIKDPKQKEKFLNEILPTRFEGICRIAKGEL